jgi:hypothetical protein
VTRRAVAMTRLLTMLAGRSDWALRRLFALAARGLPLARLTDVRHPRAAPICLEDDSGEPQHALRRSYGNSGS